MLGMFANRRSGLQNAMDGNPLAGAMSFNNGSLAPATSGPQQMPGMTAPLQQPIDPPAGMFAGGGRRRGVDWGQLGAMILAANGNPLGQFGLQQRASAQEDERRARMQAEQRQQQLADQWGMWERQQQWQRDNPMPQAPLEFERQLDAAGITDPTERQAAYADLVANRREGQVQNVDVTGDGIPDLVSSRRLRDILAGGGQAGGQRQPVRVSTPEEARRLPPGTPILLPDGTIGTVPGGPASAPGNFPG